MKRLYILLLVAFSFTACGDWLDVSPRGEMKDTDLYDTEDGFKGVLAGVYIMMSDASLYGRNMTMMAPELLARHWNVTTAASTEGYLRDYNFNASSVRSLIANTWLSYYNAIVSLNSLLGAIDAKREIFYSENYEMIKGEALGLRAFLHFDMLRFWGPVPVDADTSALAIPYVKEVTRDVHALTSISYGRVLREIITDLDAAEELLRRGDPFVTGNFTDDDFRASRHARFNYHAVKATQARYYLWTGQPARAATIAREVIASGRFSLATESTVGGEAGVHDPDLLMSVEHVFALHNSQLSAITEPFFYFGNCHQELAFIQDAFEYTDNSDDIRCKPGRYWEAKTSPRNQNIFKKYYDPDTRVSKTYIPLIRLAELYFIAMEGGTLEEANELFVEFRIARVMNIALDNSFTIPDDVYSRLEKEYRKDFYGEGQMFYFYKRNNVQVLTWPTLVENVVYQVPKPEQQTDFEQ